MTKKFDTVEEMKKTIEGMVPYGARPYPLESEREFQRKGDSRYYSDRLHVGVEVDSDETSFVKYSPVPGFPKEDEIIIPTADIKAIRYGFGCALAIEKNDGELVLLG